MKENSSDKLLERFLTAQKEGKEPYFDAGEIETMLDKLEEKESYTHYESILSLGLKLHPGNMDLKVRECRLSLIRSDFAYALRQVERFAETSQELDLIRLECFCNLDKYTEVVGWVENLIRTKCDYLELIFEHISSVLNDLDLDEEAEDFIKRGLVLYPDNLVLKDELCYLLEANGDFKEAITICNELIDKNPFSHEAWFTLGRLHSMSGDYQKAIDAFDYAIACGEPDIEMKILRSYCLFMNDDFDKAIEAYLEIAKDEEAKDRIKPLIAECYIKQERYAECYEMLHTQIYDKSILPESSVYINYIRACLETDREKEAIDVLLKSVELFPEDVRILSLLALTYIENGKEDMALSITDKIFKQMEGLTEKENSIYKSLFQNSSQVFFKGNIQRSLKFYKKVTRFNMDLPFMHIHMAMAYFAIGDMELFEKYYKKASKKELQDYLTITGMIDYPVKSPVRHIEPAELTSTYLSNKDNKN